MCSLFFYLSKSFRDQDYSLRIKPYSMFESADESSLPKIGISIPKSEFTRLDRTKRLLTASQPNWSELDTGQDRINDR